MRPKTLLVLDQCIETGVARGFARAFKHDDNPTPEAIKRHIYENIIAEIYEWFDFDDGGDEQ